MNRLTKQDLEGGVQASVQFGHIITDPLKEEDLYLWDDPEEVVLSWSDECNYLRQPGIVAKGEHHTLPYTGYAGFHDGIYHRYVAPYEDCMRIVSVSSPPSVPEKGLRSMEVSNHPVMEKYRETFEQCVCVLL